MKNGDIIVSFENEIKEFALENKFTQIYELWAKNIDSQNKNAWTCFKKALKTKLNVEYKNSFEKNLEKKEELKDKVEHQIILTSDGSHKHQKFAVVDENGYVVYWGKFFDEISNQWNAELEAAKRAIWCAIKIRENNNLQLLKLILNVDNEGLIYQDKKTKKVQN